MDLRLFAGARCGRAVPRLPVHGRRVPQAHGLGPFGAVARTAIRAPLPRGADHALPPRSVPLRRRSRRDARGGARLLGQARRGSRPHRDDERAARAGMERARAGGVTFYANPRRAAVSGTRDPRATRFHMTMPGYAPTRLAEAPATAAALGLQRLHVKLETERFGLPSFKVLGASWATCRALSARAGLDEPAATFGRLQSLAEQLGDLTLVAATDGNHGRAVAHMARLLRLRARIFVPQDMAVARVEALRSEGAEVEIVDGDYDQAVAASAAAASDEVLVISDTSWPGYRDVPAGVADGYGTIFAELEH